MNDKFDELANGLAQSLTRRAALKKFGVSVAGMALACFGLGDAGQASGSHVSQSAPALPPLPAGVTELKFNKFFVQPVGDRGLELTDKLLKLDGQRVRILGYMVRQEEATPGKFLFAPLPVEVHEHDSQFARLASRPFAITLIVPGVILDPFASAMARTTTRTRIK